MRTKNIAFHTLLLVLISSMLLSSCTKDEMPIKPVSDTTKRDILKYIKGYHKKVGCLYNEDGVSDFSKTIENAWQKAISRYERKANYKVVPLYALVYNESKRPVLRFDFIGLGKEEGWRSCDEIWMIMTISRDDRCEVVSTSFSNIERGATYSWDSEHDYGYYGYKFDNPMLGIINIDIDQFYAFAESGEVKLFLLVDDGRYRGLRIGRKEYNLSEWNKEIDYMKDSGLIVEMIKIASKDGKCLFEVR